MNLKKSDFQQYEDWDCFLRCTNEQRDQILKNQDNIDPDKAFEYVMEHHYDEVKEAVFEQEADNRRE